MKSISQFIAILAAFAPALFLSLLNIQSVHSFAPSSNVNSVSSSLPVKSLTSSPFLVSKLRMAGDDAAAEAEKLREKARKLKEEVAALSGTTVEAMEAKETKVKEEEEKQVATLNADGTLYDDEAPAYRDPLSDNMRAKLMKEASTGLDSDKPQTNVILYISIVVAILVALAGGGILY